MGEETRQADHLTCSANLHKTQTRRAESALSEDSVFLQGQVNALLQERAAALDRVASLER